MLLALSNCESRSQVAKLAVRLATAWRWSGQMSGVAGKLLAATMGARHGMPAASPPLAFFSGHGICPPSVMTW